MDRNNDSKIDRVVSEIVRYANEEKRKEEVKI